MDRRQVELQVAKIVRELEHSAGVPVVAGSFPSSEDLDETNLLGVYAITRTTEIVPDGDEPGRCVHTVEVALVAPVGSHPAARSQPESDATDLNKAVRAVAAALEVLVDSTHGVQARLVGYEAPRDFSGAAGVQVLTIEVANGTTAARFHPCPRFKATGGVGSVALSWTLPPARFDRLKIVLVRKSGSSAPSSVTDGTVVTLSGDLATSKTDTLAAGTYSYSIFAAYDETHATPTTAEQYSAAASVTGVVVT